MLLILMVSGCASHHQKKGDAYFETYGYRNAITHYEKVEKKRDIAEVKTRLAESYLRINDIQNAERVYQDVLYMDDANIHPVNLLNYGKVLMAQGQCEEAKKWFIGYLELYPNDLLANMLFASCNSIDDRMIDTTLYTLELVNLEDFTNTFSGVEYGEGMVFTADKTGHLKRKKSHWTGNTYLDMYFISKDSSGRWLDPALLRGDVNGPFHDGPAAFSADSSVIYFTRNNYTKKKLQANARNENNLKIYKAELLENGWGNLQELSFNSEDYSCGHPTLSRDGNTMYFISDMPGGKGGADIYRSTWDGNAWTAPYNLGEAVNTPGNELFPYFHTDGSLYFSSDAHNSMGGLDVFITYFNGERWLQPENLNYPLNTSSDDFAYTVNKDNETGFVSSTRSKSDKIYTYTKHPPTFNLIGMAREKDSKMPVAGVQVRVTDEMTGKEYMMTSGKDGKFKLPLKPESEYALLCTKEGCFTRTDHISTTGLKYSQDFYADFIVESIEIDKPVLVLENIYYDFDKWVIRPDAARELEKLVKLLKDNPMIEIEMASHTDARGSDGYNLILSDKRARAVVEYLIYRGIDAKRLTWKGYGESKLVNKCANDVTCTEKEHQQNRRTEFVVRKINL